MTFANDHRVSIIGPDQDDLAKKQRSTGAGIEMGVDHTRALIALKRHMRKISLGQDKGIDANRVNAWADDFRSMHPDPESAAARLAVLQPLTLCLLDKHHLICRPKASSGGGVVDDDTTRDQKDGAKRSADSHDTSVDGDGNEKELLAATCALQNAPGVTWRELVCAICYERVETDKREKAREVEDGLAFLATHGESAPFLAAAAVSAHQGTLDFLERSDDAAENELGAKVGQSRRSALAFMRQFPDLMHEWYDYNARTREPIFGLEHVPRHCRCLPRHIDSCPHPVVTSQGAGVAAAAKADITVESVSTRFPQLRK